MSPKLELDAKLKPTVLILMPEHHDDCRALEELLPADKYTTIKVDGFDMARKLIKHNRVDVIICEACFPDGSDWRDVLEVAQNHQGSSKLIVCNRHADEWLWAEVLNRGGHDVLTKPFEEEEVQRVVHIATTQYVPGVTG